MKNYSRVLSKQRLENIDLLKLASEEKFEQKCVFNYRIWANSEIRTFALPKSGGGHKPTCAPPTFESGEACAPLPPSPTPLIHNRQFLVVHVILDTSTIKA